jgi:hypothetical protein
MFFFELYLEWSVPGRWMLRAMGASDYDRLNDLFDDWRAANPKLWVSQNRYATQLVCAMILAVERIDRYSFFADQHRQCEEALAALREMLAPPPPGSPLHMIRALQSQGSSLFSSPENSTAGLP